MVCGVSTDTSLTPHDTTLLPLGCILRDEQIGLTTIGSLGITPQESHGLTYTNLGTMVGYEHRIQSMQAIKDF